MDKYFNDIAKNKLDKAKSDLYTYIRWGFIQAKTYIIEKSTKEMNENELENHQKKIQFINDSYNKFKNNNEIKENLNELKNICFQNEIKELFIEYSKYLSKVYFGSEQKYEMILNNFVLPFDILEIKLNDENSQIIYNIDYTKPIKPDDVNFEKTFYQQYLRIKEEIDYVSQNNYSNEIKNIIYSDDFMHYFYSVLTSNPVSHYLSSRRIFKKNSDYEVLFISDDDEKDEDQCLKDQYIEFTKEIKKDNYRLFKNLIRLKSLAYKIPALTEVSMKIFLNPILRFSNQAKNDRSQRKEILKSALIILLINEIAHLLKIYPVENKYPKEAPSTQKNKENGKCLIYYLFGIGNINNINYNQAELINEISTWNDLIKLRDIFNPDGKIDENSQTNTQIGELDLYYISENGGIREANKNKKKTDFCDWS